MTDVVDELHGLIKLAHVSRLGVNIVDPAPLQAAADTIVHLRRLDARRQQEIERLLAVTTASQALNEDLCDRGATNTTAAADVAPVGSDDIVTRLCALADPRHGLARIFQDAQDDINAATDEIERLRIQRDEARTEVDLKGSRLDDANDEIERLRALIIAASTADIAWDNAISAWTDPTESDFTPDDYFAVTRERHRAMGALREEACRAR